MRSAGEIDWSDRFWSKVHPEALSGCWLWHGATNAAGYGMVRRRAGSIAAHRYALAWASGPLPAGLVVRHRCDVPACVNPDHLLLGTPADNVRDSIERGRKPRGERCATSKLTDAQRSEIRERAFAGESLRSLARAFGVDRKVVSRCAKGAPKHKQVNPSGDDHWRRRNHVEIARKRVASITMGRPLSLNFGDVG